jgi:ribosomal protein L35
MAIKKFRAKTRKAVVKRVKITNGGDKKVGKLIVSRINNSRLHLKKSRQVKLRARKGTVLSAVHNDLKKVL